MYSYRYLYVRRAAPPPECVGCARERIYVHARALDLISCMHVHAAVARLIYIYIYIYRDICI